MRWYNVIIFETPFLVKSYQSQAKFQAINPFEKFYRLNKHCFSLFRIVQCAIALGRKDMIDMLWKMAYDRYRLKTRLHFILSEKRGNNDTAYSSKKYIIQVLLSCCILKATNFFSGNIWPQ